MAGPFTQYAGVTRDPPTAKTGIFPRLAGYNISGRAHSMPVPAPGSTASKEPTLYRHDIPRDPAWLVDGKDPSRTFRAGEPVLFVGSTVGTGGTYGKAIPLITTTLNGRGRIAPLEQYEIDAFARYPELINQWRRIKSWLLLRASLRPIGISAFDAHSDSSNELFTVARNAAIHTTNNSAAPIKLFQRVAVELPATLDLDEQLRASVRSPGELGYEQTVNVEDKGARRKPIVTGVTLENRLAHHIRAWDVISRMPVPPTPDPRYNNPQSLAAVPAAHRMYELLIAPMLVQFIVDMDADRVNINDIAAQFTAIKAKFIESARQASTTADKLLSKYIKNKNRPVGAPKDDPFIEFLLATKAKSPLAELLALTHEIEYADRQNIVGTAISAADPGAPLYLAQNSQ